MKKIVLILPFLLAGCAGDEPAVEPKAVIEAWIDNGGHPVVLFTSAITPDPEGGSIEDALLRWGKVTISDGTTEAVMTGIRDTRYTPPYKYTTTEIIGKPGTRYQISASFKKLQARAESTMLEPTPIDSIVFADCGVDSLRATTLYFTAPADVPAYYYLSISPSSQTSAARPCMMGWGDCSVAGQRVALIVFNSRNYGEDAPVQLQVGHSYTVNLHRVERPVYEFWRAYDDATLFGGNIFFGINASLPSNIIGGYGIFSARATTFKTFTVK